MSLDAEDKKYIQDTVQSVVDVTVRKAVEEIVSNMHAFMQQVDERLTPLEANRKTSSKWMKQIDKITKQHSKKWQKVAKVAQS